MCAQANCRQVIGLLGDLATCMGPQVGMYYQAPWVNQLVDHLKSFSDKESQETVGWAVEQIREACQSK